MDSFTFISYRDQLTVHFVSYYTWHSNVSFVAITYYKRLFVIVKHIIISLFVTAHLFHSIPFL